MKRKRMLVIPTIVVVILCSVFVLPTMPAKGDTGAKNQTQTVVSETTQTATETVEIKGMSIRFTGTDINDVVMQGEDNEYYLRRNKKGEEDIWGCYYMDYECTPSSKNIIIYGHSLEDSAEGERFSQLKKLNNSDFAKNNKIIELIVDGVTRKYQVVSAGYASALTETVAITADPTESEFKEIVALAEKRSVLEEPVELAEDDELLTLSTCTSDEDTRYVVVAKLVE